MERWRPGTNCKYNIGYHLIWCPKYRRSVLVDGVEVRLKDLLIEKANMLGVEIGAIEVMPDHVHLFVHAKPTHAPHQLVKQFKGATSRLLRSEFKHLRSRLPTLWTNSYFCESVGHLSESAVKKYISEQKNK